MSTKHYHAMNGETGCLPGNNEIFTSKQDAIDYLCNLFSETFGLKAQLSKYEIYYNPNNGSSRDLLGASYCEVVKCQDQNCQDELENEH